MNEEPVIKFNQDTKTKTGFLRTTQAKFYLASDGIISLVPLGSVHSDFGGRVSKSGITEVPEQYRAVVDSASKQLVRLLLAMQTK